MNVVVTDAQGRPITGLTKDDFELADDGQAETISFFHAVTTSTPTTAQLPPDTYTNELPANSIPANLVALLVDARNTDWIAQYYSLHHVRAFLRKLHPEDRIALYALSDDGLRLLHDFTEDSSDLLAAVRRYDAMHSGPKEQRLDPATVHLSALDLFLAGSDIRLKFSRWRPATGPNLPPNGVFVGEGREISAYRATPIKGIDTVGALEVIVRHLAPASGRKSLIWVAGDLPVILPDETRLKAELVRKVMEGYQSEPPKYHGLKRAMLGPNGLRDPDDRALRDIKNGIYAGDLVPMLTRLFNDNDIALYPVGAGGLDDVDEEDPQRWRVDQRMLEHQQDVVDMAKRTGGRAYYNRNDLEVGIQHALDDNRYTYELGYYPHHGEWNGEWRKIEVKLKNPERFAAPPKGIGQEIRKVVIGGFSVHVLARGGYFALPETRPAPHPDRRELLTKVLNDPAEAAELPLTVHIDKSSRNSPAEIATRVSIDPHSLFVPEGDGRWKANFELLFAQIGADDKVAEGDEQGKCCNLRQPLAVPVRSFNLDLNAAQYQIALQKGVVVLRTVAVQPGATALVVILHDKNSDAMGSVRVPLARYAAQSPSIP